MHHFYSSGWPRCVLVCRMVLEVSMMVAVFQLTPVQGEERPVKHQTYYRTIQVDGRSMK
jgi:hypothetical protein